MRYRYIRLPSFDDISLLTPIPLGFDTSYKPGFTFIGRDGIDISEKYDPHPRTYLSIAVDGFPNWFQALGPNSAVGAGSLLLLIERQVDYAVAATLKLQRERLKSMEVKKEAVDDFDEYLEVRSGYSVRQICADTSALILELFPYGRSILYRKILQHRSNTS